jgi:D-glycero-D-manno-heptose 1,7-bisphosphate phosphatase
VQRALQAIFFDRDGTLMVDRVYLADPDGVELLPGAAAAVRMAREHGYLALLVTNQSGLARGRFDEHEFSAVQGRLLELLAEEGATLDAIYHCPHHPDAGEDPRYTWRCHCRKPAPGMLLAAARRFGIDLSRSAVIGDSESDIQAARSVGATGLLVQDHGSALAALERFLADREERT